jgi:hypothetical protein
MTKVATVTAAQLSRGIRAMRAAGTPVRALVFTPDGAVTALTEAPDLALPSNDGDWVDLAGEAYRPERRKTGS